MFAGLITSLLTRRENAEVKCPSSQRTSDVAPPCISYKSHEFLLRLK